MPLDVHGVVTPMDSGWLNSEPAAYKVKFYGEIIQVVWPK